VLGFLSTSKIPFAFSRTKVGSLRKKINLDVLMITLIKTFRKGIKTKINFTPDPKRPVYCKDCLKDFRRKQAVEESMNKRRQTFSPAPRSFDNRGRTDLSLSDLSKSKPNPFHGKPKD